MKLAPSFDGLMLAALPPCKNSWSAADVDLCGSEISATVVVAPGGIEIDEGRQPRFALTWPVVGFEPAAVLE